MVDEWVSRVVLLLWGLYMVSYVCFKLFFEFLKCLNLGVLVND